MDCGSLGFHCLKVLCLEFPRNETFCICWNCRPYKVGVCVTWKQRLYNAWIPRFWRPCSLAGKPSDNHLQAADSGLRSSRDRYKCSAWMQPWLRKIQISISHLDLDNNQMSPKDNLYNTNQTVAASSTFFHREKSAARTWSSMVLSAVPRIWAWAALLMKDCARFPFCSFEISFLRSSVVRNDFDGVLAMGAGIAFSIRIGIRSAAGGTAGRLGTKGRSLVFCCIGCRAELTFVRLICTRIVAVVVDQDRTTKYTSRHTVIAVVALSVQNGVAVSDSYAYS